MSCLAPRVTPKTVQLHGLSVLVHDGSFQTVPVNRFSVRELQRLRRMFHMHRLIKRFGYTVWLQQSADKIRLWKLRFKVQLLPLRILRAVFSGVWGERQHAEISGWIRNDRDWHWWVAVKMEPKRRRLRCKQSRQGG